MMPAVGGARGRGTSAENVGGGGGGDWSSEVTGNGITWAEGSFPVANFDEPNYEDFSIQLNTNRFNTTGEYFDPRNEAKNPPGCGDRPGCLGWQQFVYMDQAIFIQYWLLNYGDSFSPGCPLYWSQESGTNNCWENGNTTLTDPVGLATLGGAQLDTIILTGQQNVVQECCGLGEFVSNSVIMWDGNAMYAATDYQNTLSLNGDIPGGKWTTAEFNVFGPGGGSELAFNGESTLLVQTLTSNGTATAPSSPASCDLRSFTDETNSLNLVPNSCCPITEPSPGIQFIESNLPGATAQGCPSIANACIPTGLIQKKWIELEVEGDLGPCVDNPVSDGAGGTWEQFDWGYVDWIYPETQAYGVWGRIGAAWVSRYGGPAVTGQPVTDQEAIPYANTSLSAQIPYQYNEFYSEDHQSASYLVWNPYGGEGLECETSDNVCIVYGSIGAAWWANINTASGTLAAPIDEAYAVTGGARQDFVTSWGTASYATWNASNNVVCAYYGGGYPGLLWQAGAGSCL